MYSIPIWVSVAKKKSAVKQKKAPLGPKGSRTGGPPVGGPPVGLFFAAPEQLTVSETPQAQRWV